MWTSTPHAVLFLALAFPLPHVATVAKSVPVDYTTSRISVPSAIISVASRGCRREGCTSGLAHLTQFCS
jgi:hypothetical protein